MQQNALLLPSPPAPASAQHAASRRTWELLEQRRIVLREAGKAWQQRTARNYGGEVAAYFAERVRVCLF